MLLYMYFCKRATSAADSQKGDRQGQGQGQIMDGNQSQTQYDNGEIDKLIAQHGNNEYFMASHLMPARVECKSNKYLVVWHFRKIICSDF